MSKSVAILQSNYIPWKGYFDLINRVDEFILYDDMQYTRRDWRNRNKIKTVNGCKWLSLSVEVKGKYYQKINQTQVVEKDWANKHWKKISNAYDNAPFFSQYASMVREWYQQASRLNLLSEINRLFITNICGFLDITSKISCSSEHHLVGGKTERLMQLCLDVGGNTYVSGPAAKDYLDLSVFKRQEIKVQWMDYSSYKPYPQLFGEFEHGVTILDVIFNCGISSREHVLGVIKF